MAFEELEGESIKFEMWEISSNDSVYLKTISRDGKIVILVYDVTKRKSFESIKRFWYYSLKEIAPVYAIYAIVANKYDLKENEEVKEEEGREFARKIGAYFKSTSASANIGIQELFKNVAFKSLDPDYSYDILGQTPKIKLRNKKNKKSKC